MNSRGGGPGRGGTYRNSYQDVNRGYYNDGLSRRGARNDDRSYQSSSWNAPNRDSSPRGINDTSRSPVRWSNSTNNRDENDSNRMSSHHDDLSSGNSPPRRNGDWRRENLPPRRNDASRRENSPPRRNDALRRDYSPPRRNDGSRSPLRRRDEPKSNSSNSRHDNSRDRDSSRNYSDSQNRREDSLPQRNDNSGSLSLGRDDSQSTALRTNGRGSSSRKPFVVDRSRWARGRDSSPEEENTDDWDDNGPRLHLYIKDPRRPHLLNRKCLDCLSPPYFFDIRTFGFPAGNYPPNTYNQCAGCGSFLNVEWSGTKPLVPLTGNSVEPKPSSRSGNGDKDSRTSLRRDNEGTSRDSTRRSDDSHYRRRDGNAGESSRRLAPVSEHQELESRTPNRSESRVQDHRQDLRRDSISRSEDNQYHKRDGNAGESSRRLAPVSERQEMESRTPSRLESREQDRRQDFRRDSISRHDMRSFGNYGESSLRVAPLFDRQDQHHHGFAPRRPESVCSDWEGRPFDNALYNRTTGHFWTLLKYNNVSDLQKINQIKRCLGGAGLQALLDSTCREFENNKIKAMADSARRFLEDNEIQDYFYRIVTDIQEILEWKLSRRSKISGIHYYLEIADAYDHTDPSSSTPQNVESVNQPSTSAASEPTSSTSESTDQESTSPNVGSTSETFEFVEEDPSQPGPSSRNA